MTHVNLSKINEIDECIELLWLDVLQHENRMLPRSHRLKDGMEIGRAGAQNNSVSLNRVTFGSEGHISEIFVISEVAKGFCILLLKFVPPQAIVIAPRIYH